MVPPESERPEKEESNPSNLESEAASDVGSSAVGSGSFQGEVDEMLNSIEIDDSDAEEIEPAKGLEKEESSTKHFRVFFMLQRTNKEFREDSI